MPLALAQQAAPILNVPSSADSFRLEGSAALPEPALAVAINADESLIAVAAGEPDSDSHAVVLVDRGSRQIIGTLRSETGAQPKVLFSPTRDQLLIWGKKALELWNVPIAALKPETPLAETHRVWRQPAPEGAEGGENGEGSITAAAFAQAPASVIWSAGKSLFRREIATGSSAAGKPVFTAEEVLGGLDAAAGTARSATFVQSGKVLRLDPGAEAAPVELKGHRFPIVAARFAPDGTLLSIDRGRNLLAWKNDPKPKKLEVLKSDFLKALPDGAEPLAMVALAADRVALLVKQGDAAALTVLDGSERKVLGVLAVPAPGAFALSATGRYAATGAGKELRVHASAHSISPLDYVRRLREWGAIPAALGYVSHLDPDSASPALRQRLEQELNRVPSERVLAEQVERLREALEAQEPAAIEQWARQILEARPDHPEALEAIAGLQGLRERRWIAEARGAFDEGQFRRAIDLLANRIPENSTQAPEAAQLIRQAEEKRDIQTTLDQARERMEAGLFEPAEILVNEALRRDPESRDALLLQGEIRSRSGGFMRELVLLALGVLLAAGMIGFLLHRYRETWRALLKPLRLDQDLGKRASPFGGDRTGTERMGGRQAQESAPAAHAEPRAPEARGAARDLGAAARPRLARTLRLEEARRLHEKTDQMLRLSRQTDRLREHTAYFLELEAELNTLARRLNDSQADPERALTRLQKIMNELRAVKFSAPKQDAPANGAAEELDHYQVLQLKTGATESEIKSAYHRLIKEYHPDRHNASEFAWIKEQSDRMTRKLGEAYQVLSDAAKREQYDRELARRRKAAP